MAQGNNYGQSSNGVADESPNMLVYRKMEDVIARMQDEKNGIPIRTVKSFLSKIPSVFSGSDIVQWLTKNLSIEDPVEALHLGTLMAAHGYFFPISDHVLTLKDDGTFYRFQTPYFWPSNCWEPENTDYGQCGSLFSFSPESYTVWMKIHLNHLSPISLPKPPLALISEPWARTANAELKIGFGLQSLLRQRLNLLMSWECKNGTLFAKYFENALTKKSIQR